MDLRGLTPVAAYHRARREGDTQAAQASLALAQQIPAYRGEAYVLSAVEALRQGSAHLAFLYCALACAAFPLRNDLRQLLSTATRRAGDPDLAQRLLPPSSPAQPLPVFDPPRHLGKAPDKIVDILIPVYGGPVQAMECIRSVLHYASANQTNHQVVVLDDAGPHDELTSQLQALSRSGAIEYVRRTENLGFIRNMNRGMALHPWRDVVWLNSDTRVHGDWLDRLREAAMHTPHTAAVAPFSNFGELMGFPVPRKRSDMPDEQEQAQIDTLAAKLALPPPAVETCCGFCMYVRRDALDEIGYLDESELVRGYGEDTDWSLRARAKGWTVACAVNVFVAHEGSVSFADEKIARVNQNTAVLRARYPGLDARYATAVARDPLKLARELLQRTRLPKLAAQMRERPAQLAGKLLIMRKQEDPPPLSLQFFNRGARAWVILHLRLDALPIELEYRLPSDYRQLQKDLRTLPLQQLVFGPLRNCPHELLHLPELLGLPYAISCKDDALLDDAHEARAFAAGAVSVEVPWRSLMPRFRKALPQARLDVAAKRDDALADGPEIDTPTCFLIADALENQPELLEKWLSLARTLAREKAGVILLLERATPAQNELFTTGCVARLPKIKPLEANQILQLAACGGALSLDSQPGAGWAGPDAAARLGQRLYAPKSAVAKEAGALPLPALFR